MVSTDGQGTGRGLPEKAPAGAKLRGGRGLTWVGGTGAAWPQGAPESQTRPAGWGFRPPPLTGVGADGVRVAGVLRGGRQLCGRTGCPKDGCLLPQEWRREPGKLNFVIPCLLGKTCMIKNQNHTVKFIKAQIPNHHKVF